jgi:hypothetical protein
VLYGSRDWRTRQDTPLSILLLLQALLPVGERNADAPNNAGGGVPGFGAEAGAHWRPWRGAYVDIGGRWRTFGHNGEAAFGGHEPAQRGDEWVLGATLAMRLLRDVYASASWRETRGDGNEYDDPRFAANEPDAGLLRETFPAPGTYTDDGTQLSELGAALHWFVTPGWRLGLHYLLPLAGESGSFELPYVEQDQDCEGFGNCNPQPNGTAPVDGLGSARRYASERWMLSLAWNFGQGDFWWRP